MSNLFIPIVGGDYPKKIIPLIKSAKKNIDIVMYDWRWYGNNPAHVMQQVNIELVKAVNRGVTVRAVLNNSLIIPILQSVGIKARKLKQKRTLHNKMIIIDNEILIVGSHNLTKNAMAINMEFSIVVSIPQEVTRVSELFENIFVI